MSYTPRRQPPRLSRAQQERNQAWWAWHYQREAILRAALERFNAGDVEGFLALDAEAKALPEPDLYGADK